MQKKDGLNYAPVSAAPVQKAVAPGTFHFAAVGLDHGHIYGMCNALTEAGAELKWVYDPDPKKVQTVLDRYPGARAIDSVEAVLEDEQIQLVAGAVVPCRRAALGLRVLRAGKHYFADKPGMTTFEQLDEVRAAVAATGKKYYIYFSERLHVESAMFAQKMIDEGRLGRVLSVTILAPHRLNLPSRDAWFFDPAQNGDILNDIGSHQYEQFLSYTGAHSARVVASRVANFNLPQHPGFTDFGDCLLEADNGAAGYCRLDWFTPDGQNAWGDGRVFLVGTKGTLEIRKYLDLAASTEGDHVLLTDAQGEHRFDVYGKVGFPFFGAFLRDCLDGTENSMTQEHVFEAMRLALEASAKAQRIETAQR